MHLITKKLFFILLTIMAYLPMTIVNAMPNVYIPVQTQSVMTMDMSTMSMSDADSSDCHHQTNKICDQCSTQHTAHCVSSACSVSLAIATYLSLLSINRNLKSSDKTVHSTMQFQQPALILRPPISI